MTTALGTHPDADSDQPIRAERNIAAPLREFGGAAASGLALTFLVFSAFSLSGPIGFCLVWYCAFLVIHWLVVRDAQGKEDATDRLASVLIASAALVALGALIAIVYAVVVRGADLIITGFPNFFTRTLATVGPLEPATEGGAWHSIVGTMQQVTLATVVVVPLAVLTAVYLNEIGGRLGRPVRFVVDAMSGVPSIVAGLFLYTFWVINLDQGYSGFAGSLALIILMLPSVTRTAEEVLKIVPLGLREAALALGAPEWRMITRVVLPTARSGLVTAAILGVARAVGETAPMLLTAFGNDVLNVNPLDGPQSDLPLFVFKLIRSNRPNQIEQAWAGALVLVALVLFLFTLARFIAARAVGGGGKRG